MWLYLWEFLSNWIQSLYRTIVSTWFLQGTGAPADPAGLPAEQEVLPQAVLPRQPLVGEGSPCHCQASLAYRTQGALPQPLVGRISPAGQQLTNDLGGSKDPLVHRTKCSSQASAPWLPPALLWQDPPGVLLSHLGSRGKEGVSGPRDEEHLLGMHARGSHLTPSVAGRGSVSIWRTLSRPAKPSATRLGPKTLALFAFCHLEGVVSTWATALFLHPRVPRQLPLSLPFRDLWCLSTYSTVPSCAWWGEQGEGSPDVFPLEVPLCGAVSV